MCIKGGVYQDCSDILYQHNRTTFTSCEILQELYSNSLWHSSSSSSSSCCCFILFDCQEYNQDMIPIILLLSSTSMHVVNAKAYIKCTGKSFTTAFLVWLTGIDTTCTWARMSENQNHPQWCYDILILLYHLLHDIYLQTRSSSCCCSILLFVGWLAVVVELEPTCAYTCARILNSIGCRRSFKEVILFLGVTAGIEDKISMCQE